MLIRRAIVVAIIAFAVLAAPGCDGKFIGLAQEQGDAQRISAAAQQEKLATLSKAERARTLAATQPDNAQLAAEVTALEAKVTDLETIATAADVRAKAAAKKLADAHAEELGQQTRAGNIAGAVLPFVPPPYGEIAGSVVGLVGLLLAARNRSLARKIAKTIEDAQGADGKLDFEDAAVREAMKQRLGAAGHQVVKEGIGEASPSLFGLGVARL